MDDYLGGENEINRAVQLIRDVTNIHKAVGFDMCNWIPNSPEVLSQRNSRILDDNKIKNLTEERVLGLMWNYDKDILTYNLKFFK